MRLVVALAIARAAHGVGAVFTPTVLLRAYGLPAEQLTPTTRVWAGAFGVRELALPAALIAARGKPPELRLALALAAVSDLADALVGARTLRRNDGIERAARAIVVSGLAGGIASLAALRQARGGVSDA